MSGSKQVGGVHYLADYQHWDFVADTDVGYLEGNATKYLSRWRTKNGIQDLDKALSYMVKAIELFEEQRYCNDSKFVRGPETKKGADAQLRHWFMSASIHHGNHDSIEKVLAWETIFDMNQAINATLELKRTAVALLAIGLPLTHSGPLP